MLSLSGDKQAEIIEALQSTSRYLDDLLNIHNTDMPAWSIKFNHQIINSSDTEAPFLDLYFTISDGFASSKNRDKRGDFD